MKAQPFFGGTAYLGIPFNKEFRTLLFEGIQLYGANFGASRFNNVAPDIFALAEAEAARRCGAEDSIIVSSGYLAAQLVVQSYFTDHKLLYAPDTHPALWIGKPQPTEMSFTEWIAQSVNEINNSEQPFLLITNSLNNLFPEIYSFDWLRKIRADKKFALLVDDSHGIGITGKNGEGVYSRIPQFNGAEIIVIGSMAKALGVDAGLIIGTKSIISRLRNSPIYAGASPPGPGALHAYINAYQIYLEELSRLRSNISFFNGLIHNTSGINYLENFPVYLINDSRIVSRLSDSGVVISSFAYPDPKGKSLNRVVLNSTHTKEDIGKLASAFTGAQNQYP